MTSSRLFSLKGGLPSTLECLTIKWKQIKQIRDEIERKTNAQSSALIKLRFQAEIITVHRVSPLQNHARPNNQNVLAMEYSNFRLFYFFIK